MGNSIETYENINLIETHKIHIPENLKYDEKNTKNETNITTYQFNNALISHKELKDIYIINCSKTGKINIMFYNTVEKKVEQKYTANNVIKYFYWITSQSQIFIAMYDSYDCLLINQIFPVYRQIINMKIYTNYSIFNNMYYYIFGTISNYEMCVYDYNQHIIFQHTYTINTKKKSHIVIFDYEGNIYHTFPNYVIQLLYEFPIIILKNHTNQTHSYYNFNLKKHYVSNFTFIGVVDKNIIEFDEKNKNIILKENINQTNELFETIDTDDNLLINE